MQVASVFFGALLGSFIGLQLYDLTVFIAEKATKTQKDQKNKAV